MSGQLFAHQKKESITTVIFNERTANIEIIHRFSIHDAEHSSKQIFGTTFDLLSDTTSQKHFADYINKNYSMKRLSGELLSLKTVGFEIDGRFIWSYQETLLINDLKGLIINQSALRDIWTEQVNLVNIERKDKKVRSLIFKGSVGEKSVVFEEESKHNLKTTIAPKEHQPPEESPNF